MADMLSVLEKILVVLLVIAILLSIYYFNMRVEKHASINIRSVKLVDDTLYVVFMNNGSARGCVKHLYVLDERGRVVSILNISGVCLDEGEVRTINVSLTNCNLVVNGTYFLTINPNVIVEKCSFKYIRYDVEEKGIGPALSLILVVDTGCRSALKIYGNISDLLHDLEISYVTTLYLKYFYVYGGRLGVLIPSLYSNIALTRIPLDMARMEIRISLKMLGDISLLKISDVFFLPVYDLNNDILNILEDEGIRYVVLNGDNVTRIFRRGNIFILTAVSYSCLNISSILSENRSTIVAVSLKDIVEKDGLNVFLKFLRNICSLRERGKIRIIGFKDFIYNITDAISTRYVDMHGIRLSQDVKDLWRYYSFLLSDAVYRLSKTDDKYWMKILDVVNTSVFWTENADYNACLAEIDRLENVLKTLRYIVRDYACYYLMNVRVDRLIDRNFRIVVIEFEKGLSEKDVKKIKQHCELLLGYINFGHAEKWRDYWYKIRYKSWVHGRTEYRGEYYVEFWRDEWHRIVLDKIYKAYNMGFDGIYLDNIDVCIILSESNPPWTRGLNLSELMIKSIYNISYIVKRRYGLDFKIYINTGSAYILLGDNRFLEAIDGVLRENLWFTVKNKKSIKISEEETKQVLKYLIQARWKCKIIIVSDFIDSRTRAEEFCKLCWNYGFIPLPQPAWYLNYEEPPPKEWCP